MVRKEKWIFVVSIMMLFILQIISIKGFEEEFFQPRGILSVDKTSYALGDSVNVCIGVDDFGDLSLFVIVEEDVYQYMGNLEKCIEFIPRKEGSYTIKLVNHVTLDLIDDVSFEIVKEGKGEEEKIVTSKRIIKTDKMVYSLGENVVIQHVGGIVAGERIIVEFEGKEYEFLGQPDRIMIFVPKDVGNYTILARFNGVVIDSTSFVVKEAVSGQVIEEEIKEEGIEVQIEKKIEGKISKFDIKSVAGRNIRAEGLFYNRKTGGSFKSIENLTHGLYDAEIIPEETPIKKIEFKDLEIKKDNIDLGLAAVSKEIPSVKNKVWIQVYAIDPTRLNFTSGVVSVVAKGEELYKCEDWNFEAEVCDGEWKKVMDIIPGQEYSFTITKEDPGYAETGVASINTKRSIYHPGEVAEIIIVVLDKDGHLVKDASVDLMITNPTNFSTWLSTKQNTIIETQRGIYETNYSLTNTEGNYSMVVYATGSNVNNTMFSYFTVKEFYEFDILRQTPVTTDPWMGAFTSSIKIVSYVDEVSFDFSESLPLNFTVLDNGGAVESLADNRKILSWSDLSNNSVVSYSARPPFVSPELYKIGKAMVYYNGGIFTEFRYWYLAVDPTFLGIMFEDFTNDFLNASTNTECPTSAGCTQNIPWGEFNNCSDAYDADSFDMCINNYGVVGYSLLMQEMDGFNWGGGLIYKFDPSKYDNINVRGYHYAASLDASEFCRIWVNDSNSTATIYECANGAACDHARADTTPPTPAGYTFFNVNLSSLSGINLSENISIHIGGTADGRADWCFWDSINITGFANPPNVTSLDYPGNNTIVMSLPIDFNFTVTDSHDIVLANCTLWANFNGTWLPNATVYNVANNTKTKIAVSVKDGTYWWNIQCFDQTGLSDWYDVNYTVTVDAAPIEKTVTAVGEDTESPWTTVQRSPIVNLTLNKNGNCRMSGSDESYADMSDNTNCSGNGTTNISCAWSGSQFPINETYLYVACNSTNGWADNTTTNVNIAVDILCDVHTDCPDNQYCNILQDCGNDELTGYPCSGKAYGDGNDDEVCGGGADTGKCINDTSYIYTGWYCSGDADDCVYNNTGYTYDVNYRLCNTTNDYRSCDSSNLWGVWVYCADQNQGANLSASTSTHTGYNCSYYAIDQSCSSGDQDSGNFGCTGSSTDCGDYVYLEGGSCGSVAADCDVGCEASCDVDNDTTPSVVDNICYYDKACNDSCAWVQNSEDAPEFCIDDYDGGACGYDDRTNPNETQTCYWSRQCLDTFGANLSSSGVLREDYCDYCNATSNQSGDYSPAPTAPCSSECTDSGTIYYDSGVTYADRSDDCANGTTTILNDTLQIGDVWDGNNPAQCNDTECDNDCGAFLDGTCQAGSCVCSDNYGPSIEVVNPEDDAWSTSTTVTFYYSVNDSGSGVENCSLIIGGVISQTNYTIIKEQTLNFTEDLDNSTTTNFYAPADSYSGDWANNPEEADEAPDNVVAWDETDNGNELFTANFSGLPSSGAINNVYLALRSNFSAAGIGNDELTLKYSLDNGTTWLNLDGTSYNGSSIANQSSSLRNDYYPITAYLDWDDLSKIYLGVEGLQVGLPDNEIVSIDAIWLRVEYSTVYFNWSIRCYDNSSNYNMNESETRTIGVDTTDPQLSNPNIDNNTFDVNDYVCLNITVTDTYSGVDKVLANILNPGQPAINITLYDNETSSCDSQNGDNVYSTEYLLQFSGQYNWTIAYANDSAANLASLDIGLTWNVTAAGNLSINMTYPTSDIEVNESSETTNYTFEMNCSVRCEPGALNCTDVVLFVQYKDSSWQDITTSTIDLINDEDSFICGNLTIGGDACNRTFNITSGQDSGNNVFGIRCKVTSNNSATVFSGDVNLTINDHPFANWIYPANNTWLGFSVVLNGSASYDSDGSISNYLFQLDDNADFTSPMTICDSADANCTFNTSTQEQCANNTLDCYLMLTVTDDNGLKNNNTIIVGFDTAGPVSILDKPQNYTNLTVNSYTVNASVIDNEIGNISGVVFEFRENNTATWKNACNDTDGVPFECLWNFTDYGDSSSYQVRVRANDTIGNWGDYNTNYNITIDRTAPSIKLEAPADNEYFVENVTFYYNVSDLTSDIRNCSLVINGSINQTNFSVQEDQIQNFSLYNLDEGAYNWSINCTDMLGNKNGSEFRNVYIESTGPTTTLDRPPNLGDISGSTYMVNASVVDIGIGNISVVRFEYRTGPAASWNLACVDDDGNAPYNCSWDISSLADGDSYQFLAFANDTLGNVGNNNTHTNIKIDNNGPSISLISPSPGAEDADGNVYFLFSVVDVASGITNCSLIIGGTINNTMYAPMPEDQTLQFNVTNMTNGGYYWNITCFDDFDNSFHQNTSETRLLTVNIQYIMHVNVSNNKAKYEMGNELADVANITTNTTDATHDPLDTNVTLDIILGNSTVPWWNISWQRRKPIFLSETENRERVNETIGVSVTGLNGNISSCVNEIRVIETNSSKEVPVNVTGGDNSTYCEILFIGSVSANAINENRYFVYYNNSQATQPSYSWPNNLYPYSILYDNFEVGTNFRMYNGSCPTNGSYECIDSDPYDGFDACVESESSTSYGVCSSTDMNTSGLRGFESTGGIERHTTSTGDGLFKFVNATPCGGRVCVAMNLSYYQAAASMDSGEGSAVFVNDSDATLRLISDCLNDEACEIGTTAGMGTRAEFVMQDLCIVSGVSCSEALTIRFTSSNVKADYGTSDWFGWDAVNITGYGRVTTGVSSSVGSLSVWINKSSGQTGSDGLWSYSWNVSGKPTGNYTAVSLGTKTLYKNTYNHSFFELTYDEASPSIQLNTPPNGSEANSSVVFTYIVNDTHSSIANCSLIIDGVVDDTHYPPILEDTINPFYPRIPQGGWHNWSVNCTDYYGNENSSLTWQIWIRPPDLTLQSTDITFSDYSAVEGENITIFATIYNIGGSDAYNITVQFFDGDWDNGSQINVNVTIGNLTDPSGNNSNKTVNVTWTPMIGAHYIYVVVDPPIGTNGTIFELYENNNYANTTYYMPSWHVYYGNASGKVVLSTVENLSEIAWNSSSGGNIFVVETGADVSWTSLQAIGINTSNLTANNDFAEIDNAMNMSTANDSVYKLYTNNGVPKLKISFVIYGVNITNVSIANSTNTSNFITGILWDYSDPNNGEYNGTQDLVFITKVNVQSQGKYGVYDYEIRVPARLREYKESIYNSVSFYIELK